MQRFYRPSKDSVKEKKPTFSHEAVCEKNTESIEEIKDWLKIAERKIARSEKKNEPDLIEANP